MKYVGKIILVIKYVGKIILIIKYVGYLYVGNSIYNR